MKSYECVDSNAGRLRPSRGRQRMLLRGLLLAALTMAAGTGRPALASEPLSLAASGPASRSGQEADRTGTRPPVAPPPADASAADIIRFAIASAGGDAWLHARTNVMVGRAELCRAGSHRCVEADRYVMHRVYPKDVAAAHAGTGKFRLDALAGGKPIFRYAYDGTRSYDQHGPLNEASAATEEASGFGFSAIRFALAPGYRTERLPDDDIEGRPSFMVRVVDPSGNFTLFGIDRKDGSIRYAGWKSPRGWHDRRYSEFYWIDEPGFLQPGRVRLYYDGLKTVDIRWTSASINEPIHDGVFVLPDPDDVVSGAATKRVSP